MPRTAPYPPDPDPLGSFEPTQGSDRWHLAVTLVREGYTPLGLLNEDVLVFQGLDRGVGRAYYGVSGSGELRSRGNEPAGGPVRVPVTDEGGFVVTP